jgi:hypothetical protein
LFEDDGLRAVGYARFDFDPAIGRTGMHHDRIRFGPTEFFFSQTVQAIELLLGRQQAAFHAFALQTEHDDDIHVFQALAHIVEYANAQRLDVIRNEGARADHAQFTHVERIESMNL